MSAPLRVSVCFLLGFALLSRAETPTFQHHVLPLFEKRCLACHGAAKQPMAGLDLRTLAGVMAGGTSGPAVVPGNPDQSRLWSMVRDGKMPMSGSPLSNEEKQLLRAWIERGQFPSREEALAGKRGLRITAEARQRWSFRKPLKPEVPRVRNRGAVRTPVDAFLLEKLEEKNWTFSPEASKRTLVRRAFLDLLGLPPTPEQVSEFLDDSSPGAYTGLIERLLESPHYGERWGRHWLDVAGFSESIGNSTDEIRTLAWRYRDYVIRSFNQDKPYDRFLVEQFAGDQLVNYQPDTRPSADQIEALTATGFLRLPPDYGDQQPIYQVDKWYDALQATVETSLKAAIGLQFNCARCHDHKFDPILQEDYFRLTAAFQPALDPEKWIPATAFSFGTWPSRYILDIDPERKDAWVEQIKDAYTKARRERGAVNAAYEKYRKQWRQETGGDAAAAAELSEEELQDRYPEIATRVATMREREEAYEKLHFQRIWALWDVSKDPSPTRILVRGDYLSPGEPVEPGIPAVLDDPASPFRFSTPDPGWHHTGRRLALARWLARPDHPLTARVMVNRAWHYHFGEGIVRTPDDFGSQGAPPTHPELLDWLATGFVENGWSVKWLHRQIMLSSAYRQSSVENPARLSADSTNRLLWRKSPVRLEAEVIRDAILDLSGRLDRTMYGPSVPVKRGSDGQYVVDSPAETERRSVYIVTRKTAPHGFLLAFDAPTMDIGNAPARFRSALPVQSLAVMNGAFANRSAALLAARLAREAGDDLDRRVRRAYELVYSRPPRPEELKVIHASLEGRKDQDVWSAFCQALFGSNEFLYSY